MNYLPLQKHRTLAVIVGLALASGASFAEDQKPAAPTDAACLEALTQKLELKAVAFKKAAQFFKENFALPSREELAGLSKASVEQISEFYDPASLSFDELDKASERNMTVARNQLITAFTKGARATGRMPTLAEVAENLGMRPEALSAILAPGKLFESLQALKEEARARKPGSFRTVIDSDLFNLKTASTFVEAIQKRKRILLTTAVAGAPVNKAFFESLLTYAKTMDAEIAVFPANMQTDGLDPILLNTPGVHVISHSIELTPWLKINNIKITAKHKRPLQGLDVVGRRGQSQIMGSPKTDLDVIPTLENAIHPHMLMTTGAVTDPNYNGKLYIQGRTDGIAKSDHFMGALILERNNGGPDDMGLETTGTYHLRHVQYIPEKSGFTDLDKFYTGTAVTPAGRPEALILGDIHVGETDQKLLDSIKRQILVLKPKRVVLHDLLNGHSISHHDRNKLISMAQKAEMGLLDLEKEIRDVTTFVNALLAIDSSLQVVIVPSNHNFWLNRWLQEGEFMKDHHNRSVGLDLAKAYKDGADPVQFALLEGVGGSGGIEAQRRRRVIFPELGGRFKVGPPHRLVEIIQHGDKGANGAKGSLRTMERGADNIAWGHSHTYQRRNGRVNVGTSTLNPLSYSREGMSNWVQALDLVGENGEQQALVFQDGELYTDPGQKPLKDTVFFMPGYPKIEPNNSEEEAGGVGQIDQYTHYRK